MRGNRTPQANMLTLMNPESVVPRDHPIRAIKKLADEALRRLSPELDALYARTGRASIPPEQLLKGQLLLALFSVRSERQLCEQLAYNLMFRWFLDMDMDGRVFDATVYTKNRDRLIEHDVARKFFLVVVEQAKERGLVSAEHFTVDGTLIEAWASLKSFKRKDGKSKGPSDDDKGNPTVDFKGERRSNDTHASTTDPDAKLARKSNGTTAKMSFTGHGMMENRNGLLVDLAVTPPSGRAERDTALVMVQRTEPGGRRITLGADKGYDTEEFVGDLRLMGVTPHVAANTGRKGGSAVDQRTMRHQGYAQSQKVRKRIEEIWGWMKTVAGLRKTRFIGTARVELHALFAGVAYNLLRMSRLTAA